MSVEGRSPDTAIPGASAKLHVLFSDQPGPWMMLERNHFKRWVNLHSDRNFFANCFNVLDRPGA